MLSKEEQTVAHLLLENVTEKWTQIGFQQHSAPLPVGQAEPMCFSAEAASPQGSPDDHC